MKVVFLNKSRLPGPLRRKAPLLRRAVAAALPSAKGELTLVFLTDAEMRRLNRDRLRHDYITDVIAFGYQHSLPHSPPRPSSHKWEEGARRSPSPRSRGEGRGGELPFGDIAICVPQARRQAKELGHSLLEELLTLAAHGALHLAGYRDHTNGARKRMFRHQAAIVRAVLRR